MLLFFCPGSITEDFCLNLIFASYELLKMLEINHLIIKLICNFHTMSFRLFIEWDNSNQVRRYILKT